MKIEEAIAILKQHNRWRRGAEIPMTDPKILGEAIDCVVDYFADVSKIVWHKVADGDLPKDRVFLAHCAGMGKEFIDRVVWNERNGGFDNLNDILPSASIKESHFEDYYDRWIEIPKIQED